MARRTRGSSRTATPSVKSRGRVSRKPSIQSIDVNALTESVLDEFVSRSGLDTVGLSREDYVEILKPIVGGIVDQYSSKPSREAVIAKLNQAIQEVYNLTAAYILEKGIPLTRERLEFIATNAPQIATQYISQLYKEIKSNGLDHLLPLLRIAWEKYGKPTPITCPYCGFRSITQDLTCIVCGREVSERDIKNIIDFRERLKEFVEMYSLDEVVETVDRGYVIVGEHIKPPTVQPSSTEIVLHLTREEKEFLRIMVMEKRRGFVGVGQTS